MSISQIDEIFKQVMLYTGAVLVYSAINYRISTNLVL